MGQQKSPGLLHQRLQRPVGLLLRYLLSKA
jgi:hypothetical protein